MLWMSSEVPRHRVQVFFLIPTNLISPRGSPPGRSRRREMHPRMEKPPRRSSKDDIEVSQHPLDQSMPFSVIIFGATGDLARKKIFPGLYQLVLLGHFPRNINIIGYGRSKNGSFEKDLHGNLSEFTAKQCVNIKEQPALPKDQFTVSSIGTERRDCGGTRMGSGWRESGSREG